MADIPEARHDNHEEEIARQASGAHSEDLSRSVTQDQIQEAARRGTDRVSIAAVSDSSVDQFNDGAVPHIEPSFYSRFATAAQYHQDDVANIFAHFEAKYPENNDFNNPAKKFATMTA